jgi:predicted AAA+ superfamily ATPase
MELHRDIYGELLAWKEESQGRTALLVEGARRVGKSTIVEKFARENYRSYILIDFARAPRVVRDDFDENLSNLDRFFQVLSLQYGTRLFPRESLIVFDEVQRFPRAREAIKYLVADGRYDYIETGSLISIRENVERIVVPSEERKIKMHPLTFPEFLVASEEEPLLDYIRTCYRDRKPLENAFHKRASYLVREYMLVGGMPQSVVAYLEGGRDFVAADVQKRQILDLYRDDIKKAARRYKSRVSALFEYIPGYLSTHEKKVVLANVEAGGEFDAYDDPLFWLGDSMICNLCYRCTDPHVGLALARDDSAVKCYMADTGLLVSLAFSENELSSMELYRKIMAGRLSLNEGMLHENLAAQTLTSAGRSLYFYTHYSEEKHRNDVEIDFLLSNESKMNLRVVPIEVKSAKNYTTSSYDAFRSRFGSRIGESVIVHPKAYAADAKGVRVPTYMFFCVAEDYR